MTFRYRFLASALMGMFAIACSSTSGSPAPRQPQPSPGVAQTSAPPGAGPACPAAAGVRITSSDTPSGVALGFTTTGDVAMLRARVYRMAAMRNRMMGSGMQGGMMGSGMQGGMMGSGMQGGMMGSGMQGGMMGSGMQGGMMGSGMQGGMMHMVPSHASVEDIPGGARLVLTPADPSQLTALREQAHRQAAMMQQGRCPMMQPPVAGQTPQAPGQQPAGA